MIYGSKPERMAENVKVYLHWSAGHYGQFFSDYHMDGSVYVSTNDLAAVLAHTWCCSRGCGHGGSYQDNWIKEMIKIDKKTIIIGALLFVVAVGCWYLFGSRSNVSNNGGEADQVRSDLSAVGQQQSAAIDGLDRIETGLSDSAAKAGAISEGLNDTSKSIASTESRIDTSQNTVRSSSELIAEGQRILGQVRERGKTGI